MARPKKTTTPTNKLEQSAKAKPAKGAKGVRKLTDIERELEEAPLGTTLGEAAEMSARKKKGPPPPRDPKVENFERLLPCKLTDVEILEKSKERSYNGQRIDALKEALDNYKKEARTEVERRTNEISGLESQDRAIRIQIGQGTIDRMTRCQRVFNYTARPQPIVTELRIDTAPPTQLSERAMTPEESDEGVGSWVGTSFEKITKTGPSVKDEDEDDGIIDDTIPFGDDSSAIEFD